MRLKAPARRKGCGDARGVDNPSEATNGFKKLWSDLRWPARCTNRDAPRRPRPAVPGFLLQKTVPDTLSALIGHTRITDDGLASLEGLTNLEELYLFEPGITDAGL